MTSTQAVIRRINDLCEEQGITYYTLAHRSAVSKSTVMNIIHGTNPTISTITKICSGLRITVSEFFQSDYFVICEDD